MTARKLWVRLRGLPPDSATASLAQTQQQSQRASGKPDNVTYLEDIPKVSLRDAQRFVNASGDEFSSMAGNAG